MEWFLYLIGGFELLAGVLIILYTPAAIEFLNSLLEKANWRVLGFVPLIMGILLIISAWWSKYFGGVLFIGLLGTLKGVFYLMAPLEQVDKMLGLWRDHMTEIGYRFWGLVAVFIGIFLIAAA